MSADLHIAGYRTLLENLGKDDALNFIEKMLCTEDDIPARRYLMRTYIDMTDVVAA